MRENANLTFLLAYQPTSNQTFDKMEKAHVLLDFQELIKLLTK
jgi:hypothetical protein